MENSLFCSFSSETFPFASFLAWAQDEHIPYSEGKNPSTSRASSEFVTEEMFLITYRRQTWTLCSLSVSVISFLYLNLWNSKWKKPLSPQSVFSCRFSSCICRIDKLGVKLKHKWKHPSPSITRTFWFLQNLNGVISFGALLTRRTKKQNPQTPTKPPHQKLLHIDKGIYINIFLRALQLLFVSWEAKIPEIKWSECSKLVSAPSQEPNFLTPGLHRSPGKK